MFTAATNGYAAGFAKGTIFTGESKAFCVPGLNCYSCPGALGACPVGALQAVLGSRKYSFSFYIFGFFLIVGSLIGRVVCGWLCPFGLIQDLLHKIPFPRKFRKIKGDAVLRYLKYVILAVFVILMPLFAVDFVGQGQPWFCKLICPSGTLTGGIPLLIANEALRAAAGWLFAWKGVILLITVLLSIVVYRPFCRYVCPLGAIYGFFNPIALYRFKVNTSSCTSCGACKNVCPMNIQVYKKPNSPECIRCGKCLKACPNGSLTTTFRPARRSALKHKNVLTRT